MVPGYASYRPYFMRISPNRDAESTCKTEVCQLKNTSPVDEQVLRLQISMENPVRVAKSDPPDELIEV
jgi:hypothetical protein